MVKRLLTDISYHLSRYGIISTNQDIAEYINNVLDISFACFTVINLYYGSFDKPVEGFSLLLSFHKPKDCVTNINYKQYDELIVGLYIINNDTIYEDIFNVDDKDDKGVGDDNSEEKNNNNWEKKDNVGVKNPDDEEKKDDNQEKKDNKKNNKYYAKSRHLKILGKLLSLDTPKKSLFLDTLGKDVFEIYWRILQEKPF